MTFIFRFLHGLQTAWIQFYLTEFFIVIKENYFTAQTVG